MLLSRRFFMWHIEVIQLVFHILAILERIIIYLTQAYFV